MALRALHSGSVQTGKRESGVIVIKGRVGPADLVMASIASLRESRRDVIRNASTQVRGAVVIGLMAGPANGVPKGQIVVVADVALVAIRGSASGSHLMVALQCPTGGAVVPGSGSKGRGGGMAVRAVCRGKGTTGSGGRSRVHWIIGGAVIGGVATVVGVSTAGRKAEGVVAVGMALRTLHGGSVQTGKRESGVVVIEGRIGPVDGVVASIAGLWEAGGDVIGNGAAQCLGTGPVGGVARIARAAVQAVVIAGVALVAVADHASRGHLVVAGERPSGRAVVPGSRGESRRCRMAVGAVRGGVRRTSGGVHRVVGAIVIGLMATGVTAITVRDAR